MALEQIKARLESLNALAERWDDKNISAIERDLALEHLRTIYDELSSIPASAAATVASQPASIQVAATMPAAERVVVEAAAESEQRLPEESATLIDDPIDIDILLGLSSAEQGDTVAALPLAAEPEVHVVAVESTDENIESEKIEHAGQVSAEDAHAATEESAVERFTEPASDPEPESAVESERQQESEPEPNPDSDQVSEHEREAEPAPEQHEQQHAKATMGGLFDINEIPIRSKRRRNVMISLYDEPVKPLVHDDTRTATKAERNDAAAEDSEHSRAEQTRGYEHADEPAELHHQAQLSEEAVSAAGTATNHSEPQSAMQYERSSEPQTQRYTAPVTPQPAPMPRLADVLGGEVTTLADSMIADKHMPLTAATGRIDDLRKAIGINDKFLMIRDLFNGDGQMFEDTIATLNEFDDLNECMIYIVENFAWNPDSDAAKLLMALIQRKLA